MRILVVGGGGREHALCWALRREDAGAMIWCAPGNPGTATVAQNLPISSDDIEGLRDAARGSIAGAVRAAASLPGPVGRALRGAADVAFINGLHLAVTAGGLLAFSAAVIMYRFFPHVVAHEGAMAGPREAMEDAAELGLGGIPPVFADQPAVGP